jgi:putrescine transport system permease protein
MRAHLARWFHRRGWSDLIITLPYLWLVVLFLIPFVIVVAISVSTRTVTAPPIGFGGENPWVNFSSYARLLQDDLYLRAFLTSITNAFAATILCLALGYPMALGLTRVPRTWRNILLMLVILPFWTSFLLRVYAWMGLMSKKLLVQRHAARCVELPCAHRLGGDIHPDDAFQFRGDFGDGLYLSALHDPAAFRQFGTA